MTNLAEAINFGTGYTIPFRPMEISITNARADSISAQFETAFKSNFKGLHAYACTIVKDEAAAEEIVQQVFYRLWKNKESLAQQQSLNAYLYKSVYNESLNYLKHQKVKAAYEAHAVRTGTQQTGAGDLQRLRELQTRLDAALKELPEQCRTVFQMSRFEELKYNEIADKLNISVKTVENHMGKALKLLRNKLADYLPILFILIQSFF